MLELPEFQDSSLLIQALTHSSYANEHPGATSNERREFVGDAILKCQLSVFAYRHYPYLGEGAMTRWRSEQEQNQTLASVASSMGLGKRLHLGRGTADQGGQGNLKILSGALEAVIGAYFFDSGMDAVQRYIERRLPYLFKAKESAG